jgi:hypothetical protein
MLFSQKDKTPSRKKNNNDFIGGVPPFNPLTFDTANLIALYNGDTLPTDPAGTWVDQSVNGFDLTLVNGPGIVIGAINNHFALRFDGVSQYGRNAFPALNQPITIYVVFNQITWVNNHRIYTSGPNQVLVYGNGVSPALDMFAGNSAPTISPAIPINTYQVLTNVFNGVNSETRTNNNAAVVADSGALNGTGFTIAAFSDGSVNRANCEYAYIIIRSAADSTATQNLFINYLKNRFAL